MNRNLHHTVFLFVALVALASQANAISWRCLWALHRTHRSTPYDENALQHLPERLRQRGIEPENLRFLVSINPERGDWDIDVYINGRKEVVGNITVNITPGSVVIKNIRIHDQVQGAGLGTFLYLALAKYFYDKNKAILYRSDSLLNGGEKLWAHFVDVGYAERDGFRLRVHLRESLLQNPLLLPWKQLFIDHNKKGRLITAPAH